MNEYDLVLINPPMPYLVEPNAQENLGLLYLVSGMRNKGWRVKYLNLNAVPVDKAIDKLPKAYLYGFTATYLDYPIVKKLSEQLLKLGKYTLLGGAFPSALKEKVDLDSFSCVLSGEGDITLHTILTDLKYDRLKKLYIGEQVEDLDTLKYPAIEDGFDFGNIFIKGKHYNEGKTTALITSRGCPFNCAFCGSKRIWGRRVRYRSIPNVLGEIEDRIKKGYMNFRINDDNLTHNVKRLTEFCKGLKLLNKKYETNVCWRVSTRVKPSSVNMWKMMHNSGCVEVSFGIESFDNAVLKGLNKGNTAEDNMKAIRDTYKAGINARLLMMINTPSETKDTAKINIKAIKSLPIIGISCKPFVPALGTDIWDYPEKFGIEDLDTSTKDYSKFNFYQFIKEDGKIKENKNTITFKLKGLTLKDMEDNRRMMFDFLKEHNLNAESGIE